MGNENSPDETPDQNQTPDQAPDVQVGEAESVNVNETTETPQEGDTSGK